MDDNIHNVTRGLVRAILTLTAEQRHWLNVQSLCQYIYCKFSFDDHDDTNATCHVTSDRLPLPDESPIPEHLSFAQLARYICLYIYPIFIFMGIFGNSLSCFIMFLNVRRNGYSANLFLTLLAFIDCLYLLGSAFPYWIAHIDYRLDVRLLSNFYCRLVYWFGNITTHLSAGLVVSVTIERFIAVKYPLIAHKINTVKNTHLVLIILATFFFILDSRVFILVKHFHESIHIVFTCLNDTKIKYERREILHCGIANEINEQTWVFLDFAVYTMIPFLIIVTLNSLIIHRLITAQRLRQSMSQSSTKSFKHIQECLPRNNTSMSDHVDLEKQQRLTRSYSMPEKLLSQTLPRPPRKQHRPRSSMKQSIDSSQYSIDSKVRLSHPYSTAYIRQKNQTNNIRLTILLLFISGSFLALTLPAVVLNLIMSMNWKTRLSSFKIYFNSNAIFYYTITRLLMIINHSINFILYFVVGKRFRQDLNILCFGHWRKYSSRRS